MASRLQTLTKIVGTSFRFNASSHACYQKCPSSFLAPNKFHINDCMFSQQRLFSQNTAAGGRNITSAKVQVNGVNIHYEKVGTGDHVVMLLPGALGCSRTDFLPQLNGLSIEKYTVVAFDPRGYGKSRPPERDWPLMYFDQDSDDAAGLMKALGVTKYSILGWSDGGITGLILASSYPDNVLKMMIWGSNAYITDEDMKIFNGLTDIDSWSERMRKPFIEVYGEEYFRKHWALWVAAYGNIHKQRKGDICIDRLKNIKCPVLQVNGHKDPLVPQEHPIYLQKHIPHCKTVDWPEGKHNLHMKYADEFNALAEEFLDGKLKF